MAKVLDWPPDKDRRVKYSFRDEKELEENGMAISLEDNRKLNNVSKDTGVDRT